MVSAPERPGRGAVHLKAAGSPWLRLQPNRQSPSAARRFHSLDILGRPPAARGPWARRTPRWPREEEGQPALPAALCISRGMPASHHDRLSRSLELIKNPQGRAVFDDTSVHRVSETTIYLKCTHSFLLAPSLLFLSLIPGVWHPVPGRQG